jgi:hypothetical protein
MDPALSCRVGGVSSVALMNFQVSIMKILASYPLRLATLEQLTCDLGILMKSGPEWAALTTRVADRVPELDIFGNGLVERYSFGWRLTGKGLAALAAMETALLAGKSCSTIELELSPETELAAAVGERHPSVASVTKRPTTFQRRAGFKVIRGGRP